MCCQILQNFLSIQATYGEFTYRVLEWLNIIYFHLNIKWKYNIQWSHADDFTLMAVVKSTGVAYATYGHSMHHTLEQQQLLSSLRKTFTH